MANDGVGALESAQAALDLTPLLEPMRCGCGHDCFVGVQVHKLRPLARERDKVRTAAGYEWRCSKCSALFDIEAGVKAAQRWQQ